MKQIQFTDITLYQSAQGAYTFKQRVELAKALDRLGVDTIRLFPIVSEKADAFRAILTPEQQKLFDEYVDEQHSLGYLIDQDGFIEGFRLGTAIFLAAIDAPDVDDPDEGVLYGWYSDAGEGTDEPLAVGEAVWVQAPEFSLWTDLSFRLHLR